MYKFHSWTRPYGHEISELAMIGWINADPAYQGIEAAGPRITRRSVIEATNRLTAWSAGGLINPVDWSGRHRAWTDDDVTSHGYRWACGALVGMRRGGFELVGDCHGPFNCWDNADRSWSPSVLTDLEECDR